MIYNDTFTNEQYGAFGKETIGIPRLFIDRDKSIGNVDVYGIEFYDPIGKEIHTHFQEYIDHLKIFLKRYHEQKGNNYIIYRRNKALRKGMEKGSVSDWVYHSLSENYIEVKYTNAIYSFLNTQTMHWCLYDSPKVEYAFNQISLLVSSIQRLNGVHVGDIKFVNSDLYSNLFRFKYDGEEYAISFPESDCFSCELQMFHHPNSTPIEIKLSGTIDIEKELEELKLINRFYFLLI